MSTAPKISTQRHHTARVGTTPTQAQAGCVNSREQPTAGLCHTQDAQHRPDAQRTRRRTSEACHCLHSKAVPLCGSLCPGAPCYQHTATGSRCIIKLLCRTQAQNTHTLAARLPGEPLGGSPLQALLVHTAAQHAMPFAAWPQHYGHTFAAFFPSARRAEPK